ncbi:Hap4 transcription factor, heteromerization domain containing protein [Pseudohyphozyma bogoriensis]|nr:Hap4 transcription factor, heteromerization domain containing protein [Pseudohyphozyma bogoriensis]
MAPAPPLAAAPRVAIAASSRSEPRAQIKTSKEWIIPPRPKPGRKPAQVEPESARNRASQKAFRERKAEHLASLEEQKVRELEKGEGEKSVFFQQQALKAKDEADVLRRENDALKRIVTELRTELDIYRQQSTTAHAYPLDSKPAKRGAPSPPYASSSTSAASAAPPASKRPRRRGPASANDDVSSPPSSSLSPSSIFPPPILAPIEHSHSTPPEADGDPECGNCSADSCFCAEVGYKIRHSTRPLPLPVAPQEPIDINFGDLNASPQAALPLRRPKGTSTKPVVWAIEPTPGAAPIVTKPSLCNGDPASCPACQDDPFGKAFCNAISESVCSSNPCTNCPSHSAPPSTTTTKDNYTPFAVTGHSLVDPVDDDMGLFASLADIPCCGNPELCGSLTCAPVKDEGPEILPLSVPTGVRTVETVPCNVAWQTLKSHPNIAFADLQMLADVVAKRTHCDGPVPADPGSSRAASPPSSASPFDPTRLVPLEVLVCASDAGPRRRLTVERGAVDEALALLDRGVGRGAERL